MKPRCKPDATLLRHQCEVEHIPIVQLTRLYGYSDIGSLYAYCRQWGIKPYRHPRPFDHLRNIDLTTEQHQIVMGTLLGDGNIYFHAGRTLRSEVLRLCQGEKQFAYLEWKKHKLEPFFQAKQPFKVDQTGFGIGSFRYCYNSITHPVFTTYYKLFYPDGVKRISQSVLERLDNIALAFWLMDDGSFHRTRHYIYLSTNAHTRPELELASEWFGSILGTAPYIHSAGRANQFHLAFNRIAANQLRERVRPYFFEPLLYKLGL